MNTNNNDMSHHVLISKNGRLCNAIYWKRAIECMHVFTKVAFKIIYNKIFEIIVTSTINSSEASQGHILNVILSQWVTVTHYCDTLFRNVCRNYVGNIISRFYSNSEANASELL